MFQKRTSRKNRALITWKTVERNKLSINHLQAFEGGVVVEFINEDYFDEKNLDHPVFNYLINKIGSDERVSAMISIRSEFGSSSSSLPREYFNKLTNNKTIKYKGQCIKLNKSNYKNYAIKRKESYSSGMGNEHWEGFLYVSIQGGQQDSIKSHYKEEILFNPACEYLNEEVSIELDLTMSFFILKSLPTETLNEVDLEEYNLLLNELKNILSECKYNSKDYQVTLLEYCEQHPTTSMKENMLYDPIQVIPIYLEDFSIKDKQDKRNLDFTHDEAVNKENYYWDNEKETILSPARPTNVFWSKHLSNMMQQNFSLEEYFEHQEKIIERRNELLNRH